MAEIPVVDFACFDCFDGTDRTDVAESNAEVKKLAQEVCNAFTTIGFVYIKNHGIPAEEVRNVSKYNTTMYN